MGTQGGHDRHCAAAGAALRLDDAFESVPRPLDTDHARLEVDVVVAQSPELAEAKPIEVFKDQKHLTRSSFA